jgi:hypothetical protein
VVIVVDAVLAPKAQKLDHSYRDDSTTKTKVVDQFKVSLRSLSIAADVKSRLLAWASPLTLF